MKKLLGLLLIIVFVSGVSSDVKAQVPDTLSSAVLVNRLNEILFRIQDSGGDYSGFWTMNDGVGHMGIKLGVNGNGKHAVANDGGAEVLWGAHGVDGYVSLNAAKQGNYLDVVSYGISLLVDASDNFVKVYAPNNATGGVGGSSGYKIANSDGDLWAGTTMGFATTSDATFSSAGGLFVGDAGSILDADNGGLNVVSRAGLSFWVDEHSGSAIEAMYIDDSNGNVGIGTTTPGNKLEVNGIIRSKEVRVRATGWPDYVFSPEYKLLSLEEIEAHIKAKGHLPEVPSTKEVEEEGQHLGEMQQLLLKKIEELTLHTIEQQKLIEKQQQLLEEHASRIKQLEKEN